MIIGITTTHSVEEQKDERVTVERVTVEYVRCVAAAGGTPVLLPPIDGGDEANEAAAREMIERVDALVLSGGGDVDPRRYGDAARLPETVQVSANRDALELELVRTAHEHDLPVLGICRGMQVMNVALGGTLYQDVRACGITAIDHRQRPPYDMAHQRIDVASGTLLERVLCGGTGDGATPGCKVGWPADLETGRETADDRSLLANSMHHQAVAAIAPGLLASAVSDDGLVEALEDPTRRFFLGVQWHPEYLADHVPLFRALIDAAR
ncbi:peptidase C26 [Gordonibacter sp. An230]|uniref:gamma-glutamyl-gamma-aminobutyrate hydrolase family protein n=1 Tax=Gordonibacter sp. An230 TaxID=1965592 RepID=UPI000B381176|nr:gamma-glutamyl-gamma-aminobutyrate hydrolase family protein [Gordonibacter sp. An230]OUO89753.1 peptidase C26 [Gordonibacter sp. An230]